jgi:putative FmdB family regulatory protein
MACRCCSFLLVLARFSLRFHHSAMPIYAYKCTNCGHAKDVLQKISDPVLTTCPACGGACFEKQVTAAGFQLKGSGWYVTDFRGGNTGGKGAEAKPSDSETADNKADAPKADAASSSAPATAASAPTAPSSSASAAAPTSAIPNTASPTP